MRVAAVVELFYLNRKKSGLRKQLSQTMLTLLTFFLWISPGFGDEKSSGCRPEDFVSFCSSPCAYIQTRCNEDKDCSFELCSYWYAVCHPQPNCPRCLPSCWDLVSRRSEDFPHDDSKKAYKRSILNKNFAYLLLKLHPFLNQTSQFGFLKSGRIRRITGNFGTEFLGKRSWYTSNSRYSGRQNKPESTTSSPPTFYSLPLNKFAQTKVVKRVRDWPERKISVRGGGRIILGSEFLGKRVPDERKMRRLAGSEFLGKRTSFDGSELLGKRAGEEFLGGSELLGKKSGGDEIEGIVTKDGLEEKKDWPDYYPEIINEAFNNYRPPPPPKYLQMEGHDCKTGNSGPEVCEKSRNKGRSSHEDQSDIDAD